MTSSASGFNLAFKLPTETSQQCDFSFESTNMDDATVFKEFLEIRGFKAELIRISIVKKVLKRYRYKHLKLQKALFDEISEFGRTAVKTAYVKQKAGMLTTSNKHRLQRMEENLRAVEVKQQTNANLFSLFFVQSNFLQKFNFSNIVWFDIKNMESSAVKQKSVEDFLKDIDSECSLQISIIAKMLDVEKIQMYFSKTKSPITIMDSFLRRLFHQLTDNTLSSFLAYLKNVDDKRQRSVITTSLIFRNDNFELSTQIGELKNTFVRIMQSVEKAIQNVYVIFFPKKTFEMTFEVETLFASYERLMSKTGQNIEDTISSFHQEFGNYAFELLKAHHDDTKMDISNSAALLTFEINKYREIVASINLQPLVIKCDFIEISLEDFYNNISDIANQKVAKISDVINKKQTETITKCTKILDAISNAAVHHAHETFLDILERKVYLQQVTRNSLRELDTLIRRSVAVFCNYVEVINFDKQHLQVATDTWIAHHKTPHLITEFMHIFIANQGEHQESLSDLRAEFTTKSEEIYEKTKHVGSFVDPGEVAKYAHSVAIYQRQMAEVLEKQNHLNIIEMALHQTTTKSFKLEKWAEILKHLADLYSEIMNYKTTLDVYLSKTANEIEYNDIEKLNSDHLNRINALEKLLNTEYSAKQLATKSRLSAEEFRQSLPTLKFICNSALRDRHWVKMSEITGFDLIPYKDYVLGRFIDLGMEQHLSKLEAISEAANQEFKCEVWLEDMQSAWDKVVFCFESISLFKLEAVSNWNEIFDLLNGHDDIVRRILDSPFVEPIEEKTKLWEAKLVSLRDVLQKWRTTFDHWRKFTKVFTSKEAKVNLHKEFEYFRTIGKYWRSTTSIVKTRNHVIDILNQVKVLRWISKCKRLLHSIVQGGRRFFADIRQEFPKLYFASDLQILDCLSLKDTERLGRLLLITFSGLKSVELKGTSTMVVSTNDQDRFDVEFMNEEENLFDFLRQFIEKVNKLICERFYKSARSGSIPDPQKSITWRTTSPTKLQISSRLSELSVSPLFLAYPNIFEKVNFRNVSSFVEIVILSSPVIFLNGCQQSVAQFAVLSAATVHQNCFFIQCSQQTRLEILHNFVTGTLLSTASMCITNVENLNEDDKFHLLTMLLNINPAKTSSSRKYVNLSWTNATVSVVIVENVGKVFVALNDLSNNLDKKISFIRLNCDSFMLSENKIFKDQNTLSNIIDRNGDYNTTLVCETHFEFISKEVSNLCTLHTEDFEFVFLDSMSFTQIYGHSDADSLNWSSGLLCQRLTNVDSPNLSKWIVIFACDGKRWWKTIPSILHPLRPYISLPNGETLLLPQKTRLIIAMIDTTEVPVTVHSLSNEEIVLLNNQQLLTVDYNEKLQKLISQTFIPIIRALFASNILNSIFTSNDVFRFFVLLFNANLVQLQSLKVQDEDVIWKNTKGIFMYSLFSTISLFVVDCPQAGFFVEEQLNSLSKDHLLNNLPSKPLVLDHYYLVDNVGGRWIPHIEVVDSDYNVGVERELPLKDVVIECLTTVRLSFIVHTLFRNNKHVFFVGPSGAGKSSVVNHFLQNRLKSTSVDVLRFVCCSSTSVESYQTQISEKILRRKKGVYGPAEGKLLLIYVENFVSDSPLTSILLQLVRQSTFYRELEEVRIVDFSIIWTCSSSLIQMTRRLGIFDSFAVIPIAEYDDSTKIFILEQLLMWHFQNRAFSKEYVEIASPLASASVTLVNKILQQSFEHPKTYVPFTMHDLLKVVKGLMFSTPDTAPDIPAIIRLWVHETFRIFGDRSPENVNFRSWLLEKLKSIIAKYFRFTLYDLFKHLDMDQDGSVDEAEIQTLMFCDFAEARVETIPYIEIKDRLKFETTIANFIVEHNSKRKPHLDLPSSAHSAQHVARVSRFLKQTEEPFVVLGDISSGRRSCVRLACYIADYTYIEFDLSDHIRRNDILADWRSTVRYIIETVSEFNRHIVCALVVPTGSASGEIFDEVMTCLITGSFWGRFSSSEQNDLYERLQQPEKYLATLALQSDIRLPGQREMTKMPDNPSIKELNYRFIRRLKEQVHWVIVSDDMRFFDCLSNKYPEIYSLFSADVYAPLDETEANKLSKSLVGGINASDGTKVIQFAVKNYLHARNLNDSFRPTHFIKFLQTWRQSFDEHRQRLEKTRKEINLAKVVINEMKKYAETPLMDWNDAQRVLRDISNEIVDTSEELKKHGENIEVTRRSLVITENKLTTAGGKLAKLNEELKVGMRHVTAEVERCQSELKTIDKLELKKLSQVKKPILPIRLVVEGAVLLLDETFELSKNKLETWEKIKILIVDKSFMKLIQTRDYKEIKKEIAFKVDEKYLQGPEPLVASKIEQLSTLAGVFFNISEQFWPHRREIEKREIELNELKQTETSQKEMLTHMMTDHNNLTETKSSLEKRKTKIENDFFFFNRSTTILDNLTKLPNLLKNEETLERNQSQSLLGDTLLTSTLLSFCGQFAENERNQFLLDAETLLKNLRISFDKQWRFSKGSPLDSKQEFPSFFTDTWNIINANNDKWPFFFDPDGLTVVWLGIVHANDRFNVVSIKDSQFLSTLVASIRQGRSLLIRDFDFLPSDLISLIRREVRIEGDLQSVNVRNVSVDYSPNFRLYFSSSNSVVSKNSSFIKEFSYINFEATDQNVRLLLKVQIEWILSQRLIESERTEIINKEIECKRLILSEFSSGAAVALLLSKDNTDTLVSHLQLLYNLTLNLATIKKENLDLTFERSIGTIAEFACVVLRLKRNKKINWFSLTWIMNRLGLFSFKKDSKIEDVCGKLTNVALEICSQLDHREKANFIENVAKLCTIESIVSMKTWDSWISPVISQFTLMLPSEVDVAYLISYLTLKANNSNMEITFHTLSNMDVDKFRQTLKTAENQWIVCLDFDKMESNVKDLIDSLFDIEIGHQFHVHPSLSLILIIEQVDHLSSRLLDVAERTILLRPGCLKHRMLMVNELNSLWPEDLLQNERKFVFLLILSYVVAEQLGISVHRSNLIWFRDLVKAFVDKGRLKKGEVKKSFETALDLLLSLMLSSEQSDLKSTFQNMMLRITSDNSPVGYLDNNKTYKLCFENTVSSSICKSVEKWPMNDLFTFESLLLL